MRKWRLLTVICLSLFVMAPRAAFATSHTVSTVDEFKQAVSSAADGDTIVVKGLKQEKDFKNAEIAIEKNLTIRAELEYETYKSPYMSDTEIYVSETAVLKNISFKIAKGNALTLSDVEIYGSEGVTPIHGDGNLIVSNLAGIIAAKDMAAVDLPTGTVKVKEITVKDKGKDYNDIINDVKASGVMNVGSIHIKRESKRKVNCILGGDGDAKAGEAIIAKSFVMDDTKNKGFEIRGGTSKNGEGAFAILADDVNIDIRQAKSEDYKKILIKGGDGRYPGGAIRGTNLDIVAGKTKDQGNGIRAGVGTVKNPQIDQKGAHYVGVVEVEDGGVLNFGRGLSEGEESYLAGFDQSYFYGPTILAKKNAEVNIYGGTVAGPAQPPKKDESLAPHAIIEMGTGNLNITSDRAKTKVSGGMLSYANLDAMILSKGNVSLSGEKVAVTGPDFVGTWSESDGYITHGGPKRGAAGISTPRDVTVTNGARVKGGTIHNIKTADENVKTQYRTGSGIVDANKVTISEGGIVQGDGYIIYKHNAISTNENFSANSSTGHGVENVKELIVDGGYVHGGDTDAMSKYCPGIPQSECISEATAGSGIKNVPKVVIKGDSLVTGGSGSGKARGYINFFGQLEAGHGIDNSEKTGDVVTISGSAKVYGGNSGKKGGHGIVGSENIAVAENAHISGGACKAMVAGAPAGSGIYDGTDVTITGGTVEAGNHVFQNDYRYMRDKMHPRTTNTEFPGKSSDAVAIHAKGLVLVDGADKKPEIKSHFTSAPVVKLAKEDATFILGQGIANAGNASSNLVEGGRYHVDIFKDNEVNTVTPVDGADDSQGLRYKDASKPLYRVLDKDGDKYVDATVDGATPIEVAGYKLYAKDMPMELKFLSYGRKLKGQNNALGFIEEKDASKKAITKMLGDNLLIDKPTPPTPAKPGGQSYVVPSVKLNTKDHFAYLFGYPDSTFRPDQSMTRAEVAAMFVRLMEKAPDASAVSFNDVAPGAWYYDYIAKAEAAGILKGYEDGSFRPQGEITRAEFAAIATRFDKLSPAPMAFTDVANDYWAHDAIAAAYGKGWIAGYEDNTFRPTQSIKRSEVATLTNQVLNRYADKDWVQANRHAIVNFTDVNESHWAFYPITEATNGHDYTRKPDGKNETWIQLNHLERR